MDRDGFCQLRQLKAGQEGKGCCEITCGVPTTLQGYGIEQHRTDHTKVLDNNHCSKTETMIKILSACSCDNIQAAAITKTS